MRENLRWVSSVLTVCRDPELSSLGSSCDINGIMQATDSGGRGAGRPCQDTSRVPSVGGYGRRAKASNSMSLERDCMILLVFLVAFPLLRHLGAEDAGRDSGLIGSAFYSMCRGNAWTGSGGVMKKNIPCFNTLLPGQKGKWGRDPHTCSWIHPPSEIVNVKTYVIALIDSSKAKVLSSGQS